MRRRSGILIVILAYTLSACAVSGLSFRKDTRFSWSEPSAGAVLALPIELEWEMEDYDGYFAVFFDRSPMAPGDNLDDLVPEDDPCAREPDCPDAEWLSDRDIFVTEEPRLIVESLTDRSGRRSDRDPHEVSVVLLDRSGRRTSESVFVREFTIDRSE